MIVDDRTSGRLYLLPHQDNDLEDDVARLRQTIGLIDIDITDMLLEMAQKADKDHGHTIAQVEGLQSALDSKLSEDFSLRLGDLSDVADVEPAQSQVLMTVGEFWVPVRLQVSHVQGLEQYLDEMAEDVSQQLNSAAQRAANLSDLADKAAARSNIGALAALRALPGGNADTLFAEGAYYTGDTWTGSPFPGANGSNQGYLTVTPWSGGNNLYVLQEYRSVNSVALCLQRRRVNGQWEGWRPLWIGARTVSAAAPAAATGLDGDTWFQV